MKICLDNEIFNTSKFRRLPFTAKMLYCYCSFNRDNCGAISMDKMEELILVSGASDNDLQQLTNGGYLLYYANEPCFFVDAFFPLHNLNYKPQWRKSPFKEIIDANFLVDEFSKKYIFQEELEYKKIKDKDKINKLSTSTDCSYLIDCSQNNRIEQNRIESNRMQSQYLNTVTKTDTVTESAPPVKSGDQHSQYLNTDTVTESAPPIKIQMQTVKKLMNENFTENEILTAIQKIKNSKFELKIKNQYCYLRAIILNERKNERKNLENSNPSQPTDTAIQAFKKLDLPIKIKIANQIITSNPLIANKYQNKTFEFLQLATTPQFWGLFKQETAKELKNELK